MRISSLLLSLFLGLSAAASADASSSSAASSAAAMANKNNNKRNPLMNEGALFPSKDGAGFLSAVREIGRDSIRRRLDGAEGRDQDDRKMIILEDIEAENVGDASVQNNPMLNNLCEKILNMEFGGYYTHDQDDSFQYTKFSSEDYDCECDIDVQGFSSASMEATCTFEREICYSEVENRIEDDGLLNVSTNTTVCGVPSVSARLEAKDFFRDITVTGESCVYNWTMTSDVTTDNLVTNTTNQVVTVDEMDDMCAAASICSDFQDDDQDGKYIEFCNCTVTIGDVPCDACNICRVEGSDAQEYSPIGLTMDCSNINAEAVISNCTVFDIDMLGVASTSSSSSSQALRNGQVGGMTLNGRDSNPLTVFLPSFSEDGFCSVVERRVGDTMACDCASSGGSAFTVDCASTTDICIHHECNGGTQHHVCAATEASLTVSDGALSTVKTCADITDTTLYDTDIMDLAKTCVEFDMCDQYDDKLICGCRVSYDGTDCNSCDVCGEDGFAISVNCENIQVQDKQGNTYQWTSPPGAGECQDVVLPRLALSSSTARATSSVENFVPLMTLEAAQDDGDGSNNGANDDGDQADESEGGDEADKSAATANTTTTLLKIICGIVAVALATAFL